MDDIQHLQCQVRFLCDTRLDLGSNSAWNKKFNVKFSEVEIITDPMSSDDKGAGDEGMDDATQAWKKEMSWRSMNGSQFIRIAIPKHRMSTIQRLLLFAPPDRKN